MSIIEHAPIDLKQCQGEQPLGAWQLGGEKYRRCQNKSTVIASAKPQDDGFVGQTALCDECLAEALKLHPELGITTQPIK